MPSCRDARARWPPVPKNAAVPPRRNAVSPPSVIASLRHVVVVKMRHEVVLVRRLLQTTLLESDASATQFVDESDVVARDQKRNADLVEAPEYAHDFKRQVGIQIARRFIGNQ